MTTSVRISGSGWFAGLALCLLAGCVTRTSDGSKPLKSETPEVQAAKYNIQLGTPSTIQA